jgi:hypothetical protein
MGWVVNTTPWPHYPWEIPGAYGIGGWTRWEGDIKNKTLNLRKAKAHPKLHKQNCL